MPMPSASLTLHEIVSFTFFVFSSSCCGHERIRSIGIACFPLGFARFCKCARPFASRKTRARLAEEHRERETKNNNSNSNQQIEAVFFFEDPLDDPSFCQKSLVWSVIQIVCAASGFFDWYPSVVVKSAFVFHILLTVQDSIETRPEELQRKRNEKLRLESALFWKFFLPGFFWKWMGYKAIVDAATSKNNSNSKNNNQKDSPPMTHEKLEKVTKNVAMGQRETAVENLIWGVLIISYVVFDLTYKQAIGTAFLVYLCTLLEDVL